jgi:membrane-bound serine protease (ClpP class)
VTRRKPSLGRHAFAAALIGAALFALAGTASAAVESRPVVHLIRIDGSINPAVANFVEDSLLAARTAGADALVIELDTPGGLMTSAERIVKDLLGSSVPVIVYVAPPGAWAASAGTFITIAANIAAMAPGTTIGAAHPVNETGGEIKGVMGTKVENVAASFAKSIARERGRNERWVEDAVRHSVAIGDSEALNKHVIDIVAPSLDALLDQASGRTVVVVGGRGVTLRLRDALVLRQQMTLGQSVLNTLADPNVVYLLLIAGLLGLYFEFAHPGVFFPGVAGAICLLIALASFEVIPVTITGLLLIFIGVAMLVAEAFVRSYGILGLGGVVALVLGSLLLVDTSRTDVAVNHSLIYGAAGTLAAIILATGFVALRERWRPAKTGQEGLVGEVGVVRSPVGPGTVGMVLVHGELWHATGDEELPAGTRVRIAQVSGLKVEVQRTE